MNTKRIHLNPQSKGSLGKSFESEFRTAWLDYHNIIWDGSDLDDRHHSFADRHPEQVQSYTLGNDDDSKSTLLGLFRNVSRSNAPVPHHRRAGVHLGHRARHHQPGDDVDAAAPDVDFSRAVRAGDGAFVALLFPRAATWRGVARRAGG